MRARDFINEKRRKKNRNPATVLYYGYPWGYSGDSSGDSGGMSESANGNDWTLLRLPNYDDDVHVKFENDRAIIKAGPIEMNEDNFVYWFSFTADLETGKVLNLTGDWNRNAPFDISNIDSYTLEDVVTEILTEVRKVWGTTPEDIRSELEGGFGIDESRHDTRWTDAVDRHTRMRALAKRQGDEEKFNYHHDELRKLFGKEMPVTPDSTFNDDPGGIKIDEIGVPPVSPSWPMPDKLPRKQPPFPDPKKKISEELTPESAQELWIKNYGQEMAERVFYNIKDELLHAVSDLKSIRVSACDTQDRLEAMSRVEFARWLLTYFTDALEQYDWPEAHTEGIAQVIRDKVRQPLLNKQCLLELIEPHEPGYQHDILTMPANTLVIDTPGELDWYKIGQHFPNLGKEDPHEYGQSESDMVISFASPEEMNKFAQVAQRLGLKIKSIGGGYEHPEIHAEPKLENVADKPMAITLTRLGKFHKGEDRLAKLVPEREHAVYALHPDKWESTFYSLTNKDSDKLRFYGPKKVAIPPGTLVGDMAIANRFYRATTEDEQQKLAQMYKNSLRPYPVDLTNYRMPELLIPTNLNENFADGKKPGRKGLAKRMGVPTKASVSRLRQIAKSSSGEKARMAHFVANMKAGRKKDK